MSGATALASEVDQPLARSPTRRQRGRFTVVCPVYNRRRTLSQALDSLLAQTYPNWLCLILDDGSTDGTSRVGEDYERKDPRFLYVRFEENRGGVVMNEIGMLVACELGEYWYRLGSDDWFEPHKLMVDHATLSRNDLPACFGPHRCMVGHLVDRILSGLRTATQRTLGHAAVTRAKAMIGGDVLRIRYRFGAPYEKLESPPADARGALLSSQFAMSWANAAVRVEALRKVRDRFGGFCDLRSRNMEDFHCNARIASVSNIVWRSQARRADGRPRRADLDRSGSGERLRARRDLAPGAGRASNKPDQVAIDTEVTLAAIQADLSRHPPQPCPTVRPRLMQL